MDKFRIDSHKLMFHVQRVNAWLDGRIIYPLYLEISPAGNCNHRCVFCAYDFVGYKKNFINITILKRRLKEMASLGVKSILYSGEGEPLLHRSIVQIIKYTRRVGVDVALATNGVFLDKAVADSILSDLTWMKISINAGTKQTYALIHRAAAADFERVMKNLSYCVTIKKHKKYKCTIGMQILLLPENSQEILTLTRIAKEIGVDYLVVKPYSQHPLSITTRYKDIKYEHYLRLADKLKAFNDDKFAVIFRIAAMEKWDKACLPYKHCYALSFWAHIASDGNVWGCPIYLGDKRFLYGNIYNSTFKKIWQGVKRKQVLELAEKKLNISLCRINCRMDEVNRYLWELKNPSTHINFI